MATVAVALNAEGPGKGATRPLYAFSPRPLSIAMGTVTFGTGYPTGGESIADITDLFRSIEGIFVSIDEGDKIAVVDQSGAKLKLFTALGTEAANASDQTGVVAKVMVVGIK